jgi:hypothetical protein
MNREEIIRMIVQRETKRQGLSEDKVSQEAPDLHAAGCEHFGTWETALRYAGVSQRRLSRGVQISQAELLQKLRVLCTNGYDLSSKRNKLRDRWLFEAARKQFGTWRRALHAAGIDLKRVRGFSKTRRHSRRRIINALRNRREQGSSLRWNVVCLENRSLAIAAKTAFGSWRRALAAADLAPQEYLTINGRLWSREKVIDAIKRRHEKGQSLAHSDLHLDDAALLAAARRHWGSWSKAVAEAGLSTH